ncbi:MAG: acetate--CoA ligase family protein, partial [Planctomycetota bacterium JB042]
MKRKAPPSDSPPGPSIDVLFRPRSVAVVGASRRRHSIGREVLRNLVEGEFQGPVFPVNAKAEVVQSMKAYARVSDIEDPVDLAVIAVPRQHVLPVVKDCAKKGVKGLVVITAGFREAGREGAEREEALKKVAAKAGMRVIGPNCMGIVNTADDVRLNASFAAVKPLPGRVSFATQSGALGEAILADARELGVGISMFASIGNLVDVTASDLVEAFGNDPRTDVILLYLESFGEPRRFTQIARVLAREKPIVVVKSGRSTAGARAAASHTGSLVGMDIAAESLLEQCGVLRARSVAEMFTMAKAFANQPVPAGDRVAIVTNAGGPGILATDACVGHGLELAEFSARTTKRLAAALPEGAAAQNPTDLIADADANRFARALAAVGADSGVDAILAVFVSPVTTDAPAVARAIAEGAERSGKTTLACFMGKEKDDEGVAVLREAGVPVYRFPEEAAAALSALCRYRRFRDRPRGKDVRFDVDVARARRAIQRARRAGRTMLVGEDVGEILAAYGIPTAPSIVAKDVGRALEFAKEAGYPVVLKAESEKFAHKTDVGGVRVGLKNGDEVFEA